MFGFYNNINNNNNNNSENVRIWTLEEMCSHMEKDEDEVKNKPICYWNKEVNLN